MERVSLKCANCGSQNLDVVVNYCVPRAIELVCNKQGCGRVTPIAFFDLEGRAYEINGKATYQAYDDAFCGDLTPKQARDAMARDLQYKSKLQERSSNGNISEVL